MLDEAGERLHLGVDAGDRLATALGDGGVEGLHAVAQRRVDRRRMTGDRALDRGLMRGGGGLEFVEAVAGRLLDALAVAAERRVDPFDMAARGLVEGFVLGGELAVEFGDAGLR